MKFGVFDHVDRSELPLSDYYEARLRLVEEYDRSGFYGYHIAEHHSTPLGMAPSPSLFLAAVAQRTRTLRFGPLIYALPLYHPLRMIEEICMLDHMSRGRLDVGFGRGASPTELEFYGRKPEEAKEVYDEALAIVLAGLTSKEVTFHGRHFDFVEAPMELAPFQKPHPPIWYGVHAPESAAWAARRGLHVVSLDPLKATRASFDSFRSTWSSVHAGAPLPMMGLGRFIVVGKTDKEALALARSCYPRWYDSFSYLRKTRGGTNVHQRPPDFDGVMEVGMGIAGSPRAVAQFLAKETAETGANYVVGQFVFGDLPISAALESIDLFRSAVVPELNAVSA
ncbi:MAG TPA: LLM class flavin-dependent oxidoreductase [Beijerinckiaceae bacterium]|nr:LLM class flavin-dependent oxidoreductase [Beijerinckiaceae bacterium]